MHTVLQQLCFGTVDSAQYCTNIILEYPHHLKQLMDQSGEVGKVEKESKKNY